MKLKGHGQRHLHLSWNYLVNSDSYRQLSTVIFISFVALGMWAIPFHRKGQPAVTSSAGEYSCA